MTYGYFIDGEGHDERVDTLEALQARVREITGRVPEWLRDCPRDEYIGVEEEWQDAGGAWHCIALEGAELPTAYERERAAARPSTTEVLDLLSTHAPSLGRLRQTRDTGSLVLVDGGAVRDHLSMLCGPYTVEDDNDVRILVHYRRFQGAATLDLVVQDATDDAFLKPDAEGIERYHVGLIWIRPEIALVPALRRLAAEECIEWVDDMPLEAVTSVRPFIGVQGFEARSFDNEDEADAWGSRTFWLKEASR